MQATTQQHQWTSEITYGN